MPDLETQTVKVGRTTVEVTNFRYVDRFKGKWVQAECVTMETVKPKRRFDKRKSN